LIDTSLLAKLERTAVHYTRQGKATVFGIYFAALLKNDFFIFV